MKCLDPARLAALELRNRPIYPPMVTSFATQDGFVTDRLVACAAERVRGGLSLQDGAAAAALFARSGLDAIHVVSGNYAAHHTVIPPASEGYVINRARAAVRQAVGPDVPLSWPDASKTSFRPRKSSKAASRTSWPWAAR